MVGCIPEVLTLLLTPILKYICMSNARCHIGTEQSREDVSTAVLRTIPVLDRNTHNGVKQNTQIEL